MQTMLFPTKFGFRQWARYICTPAGWTECPSLLVQGTWTFHNISSWCMGMYFIWYDKIWLNAARLHCSAPVLSPHPFDCALVAIHLDMIPPSVIQDHDEKQDTCPLGNSNLLQDTGLFAAWDPSQSHLRAQMLLSKVTTDSDGWWLMHADSKTTPLLALPKAPSILPSEVPASLPVTWKLSRIKSSAREKDAFHIFHNKTSSSENKQISCTFPQASSFTFGFSSTSWAHQRKGFSHGFLGAKGGVHHCRFVS